jgi:hypothetical protein
MATAFFMLKSVEFDTMSVKSVKLKYATSFIKHLNLDLKEFVETIRTNIYVDPVNARQLMNHADYEIKRILGEGFVHRDELLSITESLAKQDKNVEALLAVDGIMGMVNKQPNFEYKDYLPNLTLTELESCDSPKRNHTLVIRSIYRELEKSGFIENRPAIVYNIVRKAFKETVVLPKVNDQQLPEDYEKVFSMYEKCLAMYKEKMDNDSILNLCRHLGLISPTSTL